MTPDELRRLARRRRNALRSMRDPATWPPDMDRPRERLIAASPGPDAHHPEED